jgi:broad specificity polyphosphatase/5'/3'-nucleotidase SurE
MIEQLKHELVQLAHAIRGADEKHEIKTILQRIEERLKHMASQIQDWAAQEQADLTAISNTLDTIVSGVAALDKLITDFQNSPGTLSAADQAALDAIKAASGALVTKAAAISVTPPAPPAP